ncbi:MAG TPA: hypothetical protein VG889_01425 [Rhizomicrobium sp.]|nr:hypothetical protein [Rhizomicrobium sp.]
MRRIFTFLALAFAFAAAWSLPAPAADPFTVAGIHVDASAQSASAAQLAAIAQGRPRAWAIVYKRIAKPQDLGKQPQLDDASLQRIIRSFLVKNEKRSTTRYVGDVTYIFSPEGVARVMQNGGLAFTLVQAKRILLVPMSPTYSQTSVWTAAFSGTRYAGSAVPFGLPGVGDQLVLSPLGFDTTNWQNVESVATKLRATEAVLVQVVPGPGHLTVDLKRLGATYLPVTSSVDVPMLPGGAAGTYSSAADAAVHGIEDMWKNHPPDMSQGRLTADVRIASLAQWGTMQTEMAAVPNVANVAVQAMDIGEARIVITYLGNTDQLRDALAQQGISLTKAGSDWSLSNAGSP